MGEVIFGWGGEIFKLGGEMKQLNKCKGKEGWFAIFNHPPLYAKNLVFMLLFRT